MNFENKTYSYHQIKGLSLHEQLSLWSLILSSASLSNKYCSPFRQDNTANCSLVYKDSEVYFYDRNERYNIFKALMIVKSISYPEALSLCFNGKEMVNNPLPSTVINNPKTLIKYEPLQGYFTSTLNYLKTYGIEALDLVKDNIYNSREIHITTYDYIINDFKTKQIDNLTCHLIFNFPSKNNKIYYPNNKVGKWISNTDQHDYWKIDNSSETLIISTSWKDIRCISNYFSNKVNVYSPISESVNTLQDLEFVNKHKNIFVCGDLDDQGLKFSNMVHSLTGASIIQYPENLPKENKYGKAIKDPSEVYRHDSDILKTMFHGLDI